MNDKVIRQLNIEFADAMVTRSLSFAPNRKAVLSLLNAPEWAEGLCTLLPIKERLTCAQVLDVCSPIMAQLAPTPEDGWISFSYRYVRSLMFPDGGFCPDSGDCVDGVEFYLSILQIIFDREREYLPYDPQLDMQLLTPDVYAGYDSAVEYGRLLAAMRHEYLYELMRLGNEATPFRTLGHIAGVHHVAMVAAKGLEQAGVSIDVALVSAAAAAHDLGKYGCRPGERVPFLHYYYTDQWLLARNMESISHIAANHSTWDLQLDSLSVESLCLIYADFRSKQYRDENNNEIPVIYSLDEAFQVILNKLLNLDNAKRQRYELVYGKLHDFEQYMIHLGIDVTLSGKPLSPEIKKDPALMAPDETVTNLIHLGVEHNLRLMHILSNERKFGNIIEAARTTTNWQQLRAYLDVFREYFTYLSAQQKTQMLSFLNELLIHREGDIRRQAGSLIGQIIARFHVVYRKEKPNHAQSDPAEEVPFTLLEQYLELIIYPDHRTTVQQRNHISYSLKLVISSLLEYARPSDVPRFLGALLRYYDTPKDKDSDTAFTLLDAIRYLPSQYYDPETRGNLIEFAAHFIQVGDLRLQCLALQFLREAQRSLFQGHPQMARICQVARATPGNALTITFLQYKILQRGGMNVAAYEQALYHRDVTSEIFLDNLKIATHWSVKVVGIELLRDQVEHGIRDHILHIATHFSNLIKVSERVVARQTAGEALVRILPELRREQRNEVVVELGKGLEMGQYEISKYIPRYLAQSALYLNPSELDEQVLWLKNLLGSPNDSAVAGVLSTVGYLLQYYPAYYDRFPEPSEVYEARRETLLGFLLQGLAHYREVVRQEALLVTGRLLFENRKLSMEEKGRLFSLSYRKLLFFTQEQPQQDGLTFFYRASALGHINRFLSQWRVEHGSFSFQRARKVAFFPGTFDPFTLSHKGIVHAIRDLGFEVYLAVDEFSWSKKAQPHLIRRQIVNLSVAGDFHINLFPDDIPVNLSNPNDLRRVVELFPDQEVYIVAGSDVVANASAYKAKPQPYSIHNMNHVIFHRDGLATLPPKKDLPIKKDVIYLQLPPHLEDISSTRIRENVDLNRDISTFIDPVIQDFIYQNGLYLRDTQDKTFLNADALDFQWVEHPMRELVATITDDDPQREALSYAMLSGRDSLLLLYRAQDKRVLGYVSYRYLSTSDLLPAMKDAQLANRIRLRGAGKTLLITTLSADTSDIYKDYAHLLLSELLARSLEEECLYALCRPHHGILSTTLRGTLTRMGFLQHEANAPILEVDMRAPTVLMQNLQTTIQEPLAQNPRVLAAVRRGHEALQIALTGLYPGSLVLTLSSDIINRRLLEKITAYNNVSSTPTTPRILGENMCVPFGKLLRGKIVPNTVTKTIHTDKVYSPDLTESTIEAFPYYTSIPCQIRTIKSFNRPVILVDDLMHPGIRINALDPYFSMEKIPIRMILVGVLSGYGKDLMESKHRPVDSVYFLPRMREWFVESTLYPFIGGNTVRRSASPVPGLLPGINHILPYAAPALEGQCSEEAIFNLSKTCLESARDLIVTLEQEYRALYSRNLTLSRLPEAIILPLCPDKGTCLHYDPNLAASVYLDNDMQTLLRTHGLG